MGIRAMNHVTLRDREQARELCVAIFGDHLSEDGREFKLICQALADAREPFTKPAASPAVREPHMAVHDPRAAHEQE